MKKTLLIVSILVVITAFVGCSKGSEVKETINTESQRTNAEKIDEAKLEEFNKVLLEAESLAKEGKLGTAYARIKGIDSIKFSEQYFQDTIKEKLSEFDNQIKDDNKTIKEENFNYASKLFDAGYYIEAKKWFTYSSNDKSNEKIQQMVDKCNVLMKEKGDTNFYESKDSFNSGDYKNAFYKIKSISDPEDKNYKEAQELLDEYRKKAEPLYLKEAQELYSNGDYSEASQFIGQVMEAFDHKESLEFIRLQYMIADKYKSLEQEKEKEDEKKNLKAPSIGMTEEEVKKSTWGRPMHINRTTTLYGTSEQWVYSGYRYIYVENGKVVAIQENR